MWAFIRCIPEGWNILAPQAPYPDVVGGFSWWDINATDARSGGELAASRVEGFLSGAAKFYGLAPRFVLALGFSQGAGTLSLLVQRRDILVGAGLLAGFVIEDPAAPPTKTKIFMAHGDGDEMVPIERARRGRDFLIGRGYTVDYVEDPVGHKVGTSGMRALKSWIESFDG